MGRCNSKGFFAGSRSSRFLASSHKVLFEKPSQKLWLLWHRNNLGPFEKTTDESFDHYSIIKPSKESTSSNLEGHHVYEIIEHYFFKLIMRNIRN